MAMVSAFKSLAREFLPASVWTKLRLARRRYDLGKRYKSRYVRHTYGSFPMKIRLADSVAENWYDRDWPELNEIALLKQQQLRLGAKVFDVGAHQGIIALMIAKIVGLRGMVVAVEANWHNAAIARENRDLNDAPQLVVVEAAAAEKSGTLFFNEELNGRVDVGSAELGSLVPSLSIDDLALRYGVPDILYIDVEGFEVKVLEGAAQTLKHRPDCFVEVHVGCGLEDYGFSAESVVSFFRTRGYSLFIAGQVGGGASEAFPASEPDSPLPGSSKAFHALESDSPLPNERFFLVALDVQV